LNEDNAKKYLNADQISNKRKDFDKKWNDLQQDLKEKKITKEEYSLRKKKLTNGLGHDDMLYQKDEEAQKIIKKNNETFNKYEKEIDAINSKKGLSDAEKNAQNGFQASLRYAEQAFDWMEMQKMAVEMKKIFADPDLVKDRPATMRYLDLYWKTASKQGTFLSKAIDTISMEVAKLTYIGTSNIRDTTRMLKSALTISALTTGKFAAVQSLQPIPPLC